MGYKSRFAAALLAAGVGAALKLSAAAYGSRAALVDGLSCVANMAAGLLVLRSLVEAERPPDTDHPYGHERLQYRGVIYTLIVYSFVAGVGSYSLYDSLMRGYRVEPGAPLLVAAGTLAYAASIILARRAGLAGEAYAGLTASEVLEGLVTTISSAAGAASGYLLDAAGAAALLGYLVYEIRREAARLALYVSDYAPPHLLEEVSKMLEERGLRVVRLRLRTIVPGRYHGDAVVDPGSMPYEVADLLADEAAYIAREKLGVDLVVHIEASGRGSRQHPRP